MSAMSTWNQVGQTNCTTGQIGTTSVQTAGGEGTKGGRTWMKWADQLLQPLFILSFQIWNEETAWKSYYCWSDLRGGASGFLQRRRLPQALCWSVCRCRWRSEHLPTPKTRPSTSARRVPAPLRYDPHVFTYFSVCPGTEMCFSCLFGGWKPRWQTFTSIYVKTASGTHLRAPLRSSIALTHTHTHLRVHTHAHNSIHQFKQTKGQTP